MKNTMESGGFPKPREIVRMETEESLNAYIRERHPNAPCLKEKTCDILDIEGLLTHDLALAHGTNTPIEEINRLRGFLRVSSWKGYKRFEGSKEMPLLIDAIRETWDKNNEHIHEARRKAEKNRDDATIATDIDSQKEATERFNEIQQGLNEIERALKTPLIGEQAEPAARAIDDLVGSVVFEALKERKDPPKKIRQKAGPKPGVKNVRPISFLDRLRILRDQIYFQRLENADPSSIA